MRANDGGRTIPLSRGLPQAGSKTDRRASITGGDVESRGRGYEALGEIEKQLLIALGLEPHHCLLDVGCGSGRLAKALVPYLTAGRFLGTDVVQELLDYAHFAAALAAFT